MTREELEADPRFVITDQIDIEAKVLLSGKIALHPTKFFEYSTEAREEMLRHEFGHLKVRSLLKDKGKQFWLISDSQLFGKYDAEKKEWIPIEGFYSKNLDETLANAISMYEMDPTGFTKKFPQQTPVVKVLSEGKTITPEMVEVAPKVELDGLVDIVAEKGALTYAGEILGLGKTGDVRVNWAGRNALKEIGFLLEEHPELAKEVPKEINLLLKGQAYEGIFEELRKAREVAPKPWQMTRKEFTNIEKGWVELLPMPFSGKRERAVIHPSPKRKGYIQWSLIILNPKTGVWEPGSDIQFPDKQALRRHLEVIHGQEVKQAVGEGKPVPQEVLRDYPDLIKKLTTEHVS